MNAKNLLAPAVLLALLASAGAQAQTTYTENFTTGTTSNSWYFLNGACLTAGTLSVAANPACVGLDYYRIKEGSSAASVFLGGARGDGLFPDAAASGALRFTNKTNENGAILSNFNFPLSSTGLQVSFTTVTYEGDSGGSGRDGADGISFFLQDASYAADVGAFGGSLAYTCSNSNNDSTLRASTGLARGYDGLAGGYIGLGIDEYGNFLNGTSNTLGTTATVSGDNTASGGGFQPGRIGLRGSGSVLWSTLNATYPSYYPSSLNTSARAAAVQKACQTGNVTDFSSGSAVTVSPAQPLLFTSPGGSKFGDYPAIPGAFKVLPTTQPIANEAATNRGQAVPITYNLKITQDGLLSLSYNYNGGATQAVIANVDITQKNASGVAQNPLPDSVRFGFAGSTGGSRNVHEIMCFQATPNQLSSSSAGVNQRQSARVQTGTQVYLAYYNPQTWAGSLTSQYIDQDATNSNLLTIDNTINWDGSCVLTGVLSGQTCDATGPVGPISAQGPGSRVILTWNGTTGIPFQWSNLTTAQKAALDTGDPYYATLPATQNQYRLNYLRGDRTQELVPTSATAFTGLYRDRVSVLGDIIDSSPTWVGPPALPYPNTWADSYRTTGDTFPENSGQTYATFSSNGTTASGNYQQRTNVVYTGANDGMLHGFRTGSYGLGNVYNNANNDGQEVLAYIPNNVVNNIQGAVATRNFSDPQYGHKFDVDAPPGTGDLFYNGTWHTWLVGGLGPGGRAIYALDVTDPDGSFTSEASAASAVKGEWDNTTITCVGNSACGSSLANTFGVPIIRRFHNGNWGAVFGNGYPPPATATTPICTGYTCDAGIYVMLVNSTSGAATFYYLSTSVGSATSPNGISYVASADLDGDHITDYVYAGDLQGNLWRFDLTDTNPSNWAVVRNPIYTAPSGQPITTAPIVVAVPGATAFPHVMVEFATGRQVPMTNTSAASYQTSMQTIYGVWDWNLSTWNGISTIKYATSSVTQPTARTAAISGTSALQVQTITGTSTATVAGTGSDYRSVSANTVCYADASGCSQYGWYLNLVSGAAYPTDPAVPQTSTTFPTSPTVYEQVIFSPTLLQGAFVVNTTIPPATSATSCFNAPASGWTMALDPGTGGSFNTAFFLDQNGDSINAPNGPATGLALSGTGTASGLTAQGGATYLLTQTSGSSSGTTGGSTSGGTGNGSTTSGGNTAVLVHTKNAGDLKGKRLTWIQKR